MLAYLAKFATALVLYVNTATKEAQQLPPISQTELLKTKNFERLLPLI